MGRSTLVFRRPDVWQPLSYRLELPVEILELKSCRLGVSLIELSSAGCGLWAGFRIRVHRPILLFVDGFAPIKGRTLWSDSGFAELEFAERLHLSVVQHMARLSAATPPDNGSTPGVPRAAHAEYASLAQEMGRRA